MLMLLIAMTAVMPTVWMLVLAWGGENTTGLNLWAVSLLLYAVGFVLLIDRFLPQPWLPERITVIAGNALRTLALGGLLWAVYVYQRRALSLWLGLTPPALGVLLYMLAADAPALRVGVGNVLLAAQVALVIYALVQKPWRTPGRGVWMVVAGLGLALLAFAWRLLALAAGYPVARYTTGSAVQTLTLVGPLLALMWTCIGFLYMFKERADETNRRLAVLDPLTGALNRRALTAALEHEIQRARRTGQPVALLMVDVDHFKRINDAHGHLAGDAVLRHLVEVIKERLRAPDVLARFGGEEFVVLAPDTDAAGAVQLAESLRAAIAAQPAPLADQRVPFTISVGVTTQAIDTATHWQALLNRADRALYQAKHDGRDRVFHAADGVWAAEPDRAALAP